MMTKMILHSELRVHAKTAEKFSGFVLNFSSNNKNAKARVV